VPAFGPIKRSDLIRFMRQLGFTGPEPGGKHMYMVRDSHRVRIPNPHQSDISAGLLATILRQAGIDRATWEAL
jgi:predicted RNA binding protein YcfA (HicA-like mRNA interferase family)